jgi:curved DNA-binding protein CbpA
MALEVINSGLRALTRKHHPDLGGNHEDMVAVNRAVEALRKLVS